MDPSCTFMHWLWHIWVKKEVTPHPQWELRRGEIEEREKRSGRESTGRFRKCVPACGNEEGPGQGNAGRPSQDKGARLPWWRYDERKCTWKCSELGIKSTCRSKGEKRGTRKFSKTSLVEKKKKDANCVLIHPIQALHQSCNGWTWWGSLVMCFGIWSGLSPCPKASWSFKYYSLFRLQQTIFYLIRNQIQLIVLQKGCPIPV